MNRSALKTYAPKARLDFIRAITDRAAFFGLTPDHAEPLEETGDVVIIAGRAFSKVVAQQRRSLEARVKDHGFAQVMEAMAYTWFNRFVALRYMELHGYLEHGYRVLSHPEGKPTPEILEHAEHVTLPGLDPQKVIELKLDGGKDAELYRLLLVAQCNALHEAMPFLFEKIADETELLLPDNLLHSDSLIRKLVTELDEADWQQIEIIGWLYQFYIEKEKARVDAEVKTGKTVATKDIPAKTQLFTPNWIVKYLVQNTLGRQWLATYPDSPLRQQMEYYIEPAAQTDHVQAQLAAITPQSLDPETLTLLDPASGSGHILVEAYDLFKAIYQERGYRSKDIPRLILEKNLFGLEIDDRAAQLAAFALLMKARADDRRIFADHVQPNVIAIQESKGLENLLRPDPAAAKGVGELPFADSDLFPQTAKQLTLTKPNQESPLAAVEPCLRELIKLFEHGKNFGSLIRVPTELAAQLPAARQSIETMAAKGQLWEHRAATLLLPLVKQAELISDHYCAVVANPPYLGRKTFNSHLKNFAEMEFPKSASDLFAMFIERGFEWTQQNGFHGMVTMQSWMFLSSYQELRELLLMTKTLVSQMHMASGVMGIAFGTAATVFNKHPLPGFVGQFFYVDSKDLDEGGVFTDIPVQTSRLNLAQARDFLMIPGSPISYWASHKLRGLFRRSSPLESLCTPRQGLGTTNNAMFVRCWHEVDWRRIGFSMDGREAARLSGLKWFPYNKGGPFRRWYGNNDHVVNWHNDGAAVKEYIRFKNPNVARAESHYFREGITWGLITSAVFSCRYMPKGFIFDVGGSCAFPDQKQIPFCLALLNSNLCLAILRCLNPTMNTQVGDLQRLPVIQGDAATAARIDEQVNWLIELSKQDWDSMEASWEFQTTPLLITRGSTSDVSSSFSLQNERLNAAILRAKELERQCNQLLIDCYGVTGEVSAEVRDDHICLTRPDRQHDIERLVSYAIGCMMGRYSLDKPGLVYGHSRNEGFDASQYPTFPADADGIIPITELAWFPDDATERFVEFIGKAWPAEHLEENLKFIADSLGANRDEHPRDTIRRYLSQNFYKDHLQTYKRRPIYWLFSSGKQKAFQCLVYLHRYHEGTLARMRTEYVIPLQGKLSQRIEQLGGTDGEGGDIAAATSTVHRKKLQKELDSLKKQRTELAAFDEKLRHYADQRIALDLDDGVKVNYAKFGDLLAEVKAVTGGTEE